MQIAIFHQYNSYFYIKRIKVNKLFFTLIFLLFNVSIFQATEDFSATNNAAKVSPIVEKILN